ncbi:MAG: phosphosulfolactate synthase, partial [Flavobacteriales bacterium]
MNFKLNHLPERTKKNREHGLTMVMDKALTIRQAEDLIESSGEFVDIVKLGFGTSAFASNVKEKVKLYQKNDMKVYVGGTLFEAFYVRGQMDDY